MASIGEGRGNLAGFFWCLFWAVLLIGRVSDRSLKGDVVNVLLPRICTLLSLFRVRSSHNIVLVNEGGVWKKICLSVRNLAKYRNCTENVIFCDFSACHCLT